MTLCNVYSFIQDNGILKMILEVAILDIKPELIRDFETNFKIASSIITSISGYLSHELQRCVENPNRYILLVRWQTLEDHIVGFRQSAEYQRWRFLLHHFYEPFPVVEHYEVVQFFNKVDSDNKFKYEEP